jgi:prevent-host-death family protein
MERITMLEFRRHAASILRKAQQGKRFILTYRGKPVLRLEPVRAAGEISEDDPIYRLGRMADAGGEKLTNEQIDAIVYGK